MSRPSLTHLVALAALLLGAGFSLADAFAAPKPILLPPTPGTSLAERMAHHRAEAAARTVHPLPDWSVFPAGAAIASAYGALFEQGWRVEHQEATVRIDPASSSLAAEVTATVTVLDEGLETLALRSELVEMDALDVSSDLSGDATITSSYATQFGQIGVITMTPSQPLAKGQTLTIRARYHATLDCAKKTSLLRTCTFDADFAQVLFFRYFFDHTMVQHAPFTSLLHVVTAADKVAAAPGTPLGSQPLPSGELLWSFQQDERTENGGIAIASYVATGTDPATAKAGEPWLRLLTLPSYAKGAGELRTSIQQMLGFFGQRFGAFPWSGLSVVQVANNFGGGYAPLSGIFMLRNVFGAQKDGMGWVGWSELAAHEVAHQWWGNLARPMSSGDVSLSESLAEFSSCLFTELTLKSRSQLVEDNLSYIYTVEEGSDRALGAGNVYSSPSYVQIVYHKGAVVFDMLRWELGDKAMLDGLAAYAKAFDRDYAKIADLRAAIEASAGVDLGWFFSQWFQRPGHIDLEITSKVAARAEGGFRLELRLAQLSKDPYRFKMPLRLTFADGEVRDVVAEVLPPTEGFVSVVTIDLDKRPLIVRPDVSRRLLRHFTVLDGADVSLDGIVDGVDLVESAFRQGRTILWKGGFYANPSWDELFDGDASYGIGAGDLDRIYSFAGSGASVDLQP